MYFATILYPPLLTFQMISNLQQDETDCLPNGDQENMGNNAGDNDFLLSSIDPGRLKEIILETTDKKLLSAKVHYFHFVILRIRCFRTQLILGFIFTDDLLYSPVYKSIRK